jgi:hypothetical protein
MATGPDGYVVRSCTRPDCAFRLHDRGDGADTDLDTAVGQETRNGAVSPSNGFLAVTETVGGTSTLRVSVLATGQITNIFAAPASGRNDAVWLDDTWLVLASEDHLVLYDVVDDLVVTPDLPLRGIGALAWAPA